MGGAIPAAVIVIGAGVGGVVLPSGPAWVMRAMQTMRMMQTMRTMREMQAMPPPPSPSDCNSCPVPPAVSCYLLLCDLVCKSSGVESEHWT